MDLLQQPVIQVTEHVRKTTCFSAVLPRFLMKICCWFKRQPVVYFPGLQNCFSWCLVAWNKLLVGCSLCQYFSMDVLSSFCFSENLITPNTFTPLAADSRGSYTCSLHSLGEKRVPPSS